MLQKLIRQMLRLNLNKQPMLPTKIPIPIKLLEVENLFVKSARKHFLIINNCFCIRKSTSLKDHTDVIHVVFPSEHLVLYKNTRDPPVISTKSISMQPLENPRHGIHVGFENSFSCHILLFFHCVSNFRGRLRDQNT